MPTETEPQVVPALDHAPVDRPRGVVLMLHGGAERSSRRVDHRSLSWQRSRRMMRETEDSFRGAGVAVALLRYRWKGWNASPDRLPTPVSDAEWALHEVQQEYGDVPVVLLGHSMGARTAVHVADHASVLGVVALAPWFPPGEPVDALRGRSLRAAHGRRDRITSPRATAAYVQRARAAGADAELTDMGRVGHYMLRRAERWNDYAVAHALDLLGGAASG